MSKPHFMIIQALLIIALMSVMAGSGMNLRTSEFWSVVNIAIAMGLVGFLWGDQA